MDKKEIKYLLKNYHYYKMQIKNNLASSAVKEKTRYIENCIDILDKESRHIMMAVFFEKRSCGELARGMGYARRSIYYKIDKIIEKIASASRYDKEKS